MNITSHYCRFILLGQTQTTKQTTKKTKGIQTKSKPNALFDLWGVNIYIKTKHNNNFGTAWCGFESIKIPNSIA